MTNPFLSSEEYDERAHALYNEGRYDEALDVLRDGLALYPHAVELHVGMGYARLAREEYAWARRAFDQALDLDGEHEDALAGLGEVLMKFGQRDRALATFRRTLELGYEDDVELMLQIGRALFREGLIEEAKSYFEVAVQQAPDNAEAVACVGYALHRMGDDDGAAASLRRALQMDGDHVEARVYLGNLLYDRGEYEAALYHLDRSSPDDHWDELGIWRLVELKKQIHRLKEDDPELKPWEARLAELTGDADPVDELLAELEERAAEAEDGARGQLDLFGDEPAATTATAPTREVERETEREAPGAAHHVVTSEGEEIEGTWEEIVQRLRDASGNEFAGQSVTEFMTAVSRRTYRKTGIRLATRDAESFVRASADAGLLRIVR